MDCKKSDETLYIEAAKCSVDYINWKIDELVKRRKQYDDILVKYNIVRPTEEFKAKATALWQELNEADINYDEYVEVSEHIVNLFATIK